MVWWRCRSCGDTTNELLSTCNGCGAPREPVAPSAADDYVETTVRSAEQRSAGELREVAARFLALAEQKEGEVAAAPAPAAPPTGLVRGSDDDAAPAPVAAAPARKAEPPTAGGSSSDESDDGDARAAPAPATPAARRGPTSATRLAAGAILVDDSPAPAAAPPTAGGSSSDDSEDASDDERDSKRPRRGDDSDDDVLVLEERTYLVERNRILEDENEDLRSRLAARAPPQQGAMTQLFDELIHADDGDADADRRRVERRGASTVRYFVSVEGRMEKILRLRGVAARCRGWRTKLDGIGAPRSLRDNLGRLKGLRNAAAHEVDCERIAATTDDDLAGLIRDIDRDLKVLEASAGAGLRSLSKSVSVIPSVHRR